jgi:hypothetical protein
MIFALKKNWTLDDLPLEYYYLFLGLSGAFGTFIGVTTSSWIIGLIVGVIFYLSVSVYVMALEGVFEFGADKIGINTMLIVVLPVLSVLLVRDSAGGFIGGVGVIAAGVLAYFAINLLYDLAGLPAIILFCFAWLGAFMLVYFIAKRQERRAQNPLRGFLEPSGAAVSLRQGGRRWGWFR